MRKFAILVILFFTLEIDAQLSKLENSLKQNLRNWDTTSSSVSGEKVLDRLRSLCVDYPESWQAKFYLSFLLTQQTRWDGMNNKKTLLDEAMTNYLKAMQEFKLRGKTEVVPSHCVSLEYLINVFYAEDYYARRDSLNYVKFKNISEQKLNEVIKMNQEDPVVLTQVGINLIQLGNQRRDNSFILSGKLALEKASKHFEKAKDFDFVNCSNWCRDWPDKWLKYAVQIK
ncbi:MAG: hypothetical protein JNL24_01590 [Bacteroidia bacterium]|nr:hypothetical protein [Bacteroidia bacterium]